MRMPTGMRFWTAAALARAAMATGIVGLAMTGGAQAQEFLIAPTRAVFDGGATTQEITVMNRGSETRTYRVQLENRRLEPDGRYIVATDVTPGDKFASGFVRLSTHQLTLGPLESGTIRLVLRKPGGTPKGEYRSHLIVRESPTLDDAEPGLDVGGGLSIRMTPVLGISIPVIVHQGDLSARVEVTNATRAADARTPDLENVTVTLEANGDRSEFVDLRLLGQSGRHSQSYFEMRGVSVYWPNNRRTVTLSLTAQQTARLREGTTRLQWQTVDPNGQPIGPASERPIGG